MTIRERLAQWRIEADYQATRSAGGHIVAMRRCADELESDLDLLKVSLSALEHNMRTFKLHHPSELQPALERWANIIRALP